MNRTCELCSEKLEFYCPDCPKTHFYCKECFKFIHNKNKEMGSHKPEVLTSSSSNSVKLGEILLCSTHSNKAKEYVCLDCDDTVCSDCVAFGYHRRHLIGSFKKGYDKLVDEYNSNLSMDDKLKDLPSNVKLKASEFLNENLKKMKIVRIKTERDFQNLIEFLKEREMEILKDMDADIGNIVEERDSIADINAKITSSIATCNEELKKATKIGCLTYDSFMKACTRTRRLKSYLQKWTSTEAFKERAYPLIPLDSVHKQIASLKVGGQLDTIVEPIHKSIPERIYEDRPIAGIKQPVIENGQSVITIRQPIPEVEPVGKPPAKEIKQPTINKPETSEGKTIDLAIFENSSILNDPKDQTLLHDWVSEVYNSKVRFQLLWKGSVDGFKATVFHSKCDGKGATCTVIKSNEDYVFGGYASNPWKSSGGFTYDSKAFLYSLTHKAKHATQKDHGNSVYYDDRFGPIFGSGFDLCVVDNCYDIGKSYSRGNNTYELPMGTDELTYYAGSFKFKIKEIEVYSVLTI